MLDRLDLITFTPVWLLRILADGATAIHGLVPSVLGLIMYGIICSIIVDATVSFASGRFLKRAVKRLTTSTRPIGDIRSRFSVWLPLAARWLFKAWLGLPSLYILNLLMSADRNAYNELETLVTGYSWQEAVLEGLEAAPMSLLAQHTIEARVTQFSIATALLLYTYWYYARGFALVKGIRLVGDAIRSRVSSGEERAITLDDAYRRLRLGGWSQLEAKAAMWFLAMINVRVTVKNTAYGAMTAAEYGRFRVLTTFGIALGLSSLHPLVGGIYLGSTLYASVKMLQTWRDYRKSLAHLPPTLRL